MSRSLLVISPMLSGALSALSAVTLLLRTNATYLLISWLPLLLPLTLDCSFFNQALLKFYSSRIPGSTSTLDFELGAQWWEALLLGLLLLWKQGLTA